MAEQEQSKSGGGLSRFLFTSIIILASLLAGIFLGFYFGHLVTGQKPASASAAGDGAAGDGAAGDGAAGDGGGGGVVHDTCTIHLRDGTGALRSDLAKVALLDGAGKQALEPELVHATTIRVACPAEAVGAELVAQTRAGELFLVAGASLDPARGYVELELPAEASEADAVAARWTELGLGDAPTWLTEPPSLGDDAGDEDGGDDGGEVASGPGIDVGEPRKTEGDLYVEFRDVVGEARAKPDMRELVKTNGYQIEACIQQVAPDLERARHTFFVAVAKSGKIAESQLLQGETPELDACVEQVMATWDFGAAEESSFFQLKTVWTS